MRIHALLLAGVLGANGCSEVDEPIASQGNQLVGGSSEPDHLFPWQVEVGYKCQGTLISPLWVLTSARCTSTEWYDVFTHRRTDPATGQVVQQERRMWWGPFGKNGWHTHPGYRGCAADGFCLPSHDLALLRLDAPFTLDKFVRPALLPANLPVLGHTGTLASSRSLGAGLFSLLRAVVRTQESPYYCGRYDSESFCVTAPDAGTCAEDHGSGFVTYQDGRPTVTGVLSTEDAGPDGCAPAGSASVLASVSAELDWIISVMQEYHRPSSWVSAPANAMCRTAPARVRPGKSRARAGVAEIWPEYESTSFTVHPSGGNRFGVFEEWATRDGGFSPDTRWAVGDFDSDGDQDLMGIWNDGGKNTFTLRRANEFSFSHEHWKVRLRNWASTAEWLPGDFNRDGKTDLVSVQSDHGSYFNYYTSNGSELVLQSDWWDGGWSSAMKWNVGDFNNDGRDDIVTAWNDGGKTTLTVRSRWNGGVFTPQHWSIRAAPWSDSTRYLTGDFNGDGLGDVAAVMPDGTQTSFHVYLSTGSGFLPPVPWSLRDGGWGSTIRWSTGDFDADGRADILAVWNDGGMTTMTVRRSTGTTFQQQHFAIRRVPWHASTYWCAGTFREGPSAVLGEPGDPGGGTLEP